MTKNDRSSVNSILLIVVFKIKHVALIQTITLVSTDTHLKGQKGQLDRGFKVTDG